MLKTHPRVLPAAGALDSAAPDLDNLSSLNHSLAVTSTGLVIMPAQCCFSIVKPSENMVPLWFKVRELVPKKSKKKSAQAPNQIDRCLGSAKIRGSPLRLHFSKSSGIPLAGKGQPVAL